MWHVVKRLAVANQFEFVRPAAGFHSYDAADAWMRITFYDGKAPQDANYFVIMVPLV